MTQFLSKLIIWLTILIISILSILVISPSHIEIVGAGVLSGLFTLWVVLLFLRMPQLYSDIVNEISTQTVTKLASRLPEPPATSEAEQAELAYTYFADRYGIGYDELEVDCVIRPDGSAIIQRLVRVEAYSEVGRLDTYLVTPEGKNELSIPKVDTLSSNRKVNLEQVNREATQLSTIITISPALNSGETVNYKVTEQVPSETFAINLSIERLKQRKNPEEYFGWNINRPTRRLSLQVYFPENIRPAVYRNEVRYASAGRLPSTTVNYDEQRRLPPPLH